MKALTCQVIETNGTLAKDSSLNHPRPKPWSLLSLAFHLGFNVLLYLFLPIIPMQLMKVVQVHNYLFFLLFIFRQRGREGEREGEKQQCVVASHVPQTGDLACNPGMCPDWESN